MMLHALGVTSIACVRPELTQQVENAILAGSQGLVTAVRPHVLEFILDEIKRFEIEHSSKTFEQSGGESA